MPDRFEQDFVITRLPWGFEVVTWSGRKAVLGFDFAVASGPEGSTYIRIFVHYGPYLANDRFVEAEKKIQVCNESFRGRPLYSRLGLYQQNEAGRVRGHIIEINGSSGREDIQFYLRRLAGMYLDIGMISRSMAKRLQALEIDMHEMVKKSLPYRPRPQSRDVYHQKRPSALGPQ